MNYGPLIFLAAFFALASSWFGFVFAPQLQLGRMQQTNAVPSGPVYPVARPGLAAQGREVYRANGCATCHSQQIGQSGTLFEVALSDAGTNAAAVVSVLARLDSALSEAGARELIGKLPQTILRVASKDLAEATAKAVSTNGGKAVLGIVPLGTDIDRGWGRRRSVAEDYLFDYPVMLGEARIGPDLANIGVRKPDAAWHLRHLYAPRAEVPGSTMPPYAFLFERRPKGQVSAAEALKLPAGYVPDGYEVVPTEQARALVAYLLSLNADAPLFSAPLTTLPSPSAVIDTNTPSAGGASK